MAKIVLVKHAAPVKDVNKPSRAWKLSDEGRENAKRLAERLREFQLAAVVTSDEPKAIETGAIIAEALGIDASSGENLHEHDRDNVPVMPTREFISSMAQFFKEPGRLVLGKETARQSQERIDHAIQSVVERHAGKNIAIVTHGTVLSLFVAPLANEDPFQLWRRMGLPSFVVLDSETRAIEAVVDRI